VNTEGGQGGKCVCERECKSKHEIVGEGEQERECVQVGIQNIHKVYHYIIYGSICTM